MLKKHKGAVVEAKGMGQIGARREIRTEDSCGVVEAEWRPWGEEWGQKGQRE